MLRLRGDRQSLLAALANHWLDQQLGISVEQVTTAAALVANPAGSGCARAARR